MAIESICKSTLRLMFINDNVSGFLNDKLDNTSVDNGEKTVSSGGAPPSVVHI